VTLLTLVAARVRGGAALAEQVEDLVHDAQADAVVAAVAVALQRARGRRSDY
jgi:hypothetical protein